MTAMRVKWEFDNERADIAKMNIDRQLFCYHPDSGGVMAQAFLMDMLSGRSQRFAVGEEEEDDGTPAHEKAKRKARKRLNAEQQSLVDELEAVLGVQSMQICDYTIHLLRADVFSWKEICPKVEAVVLDHFGHKDVIRVKDPLWTRIRRHIPFVKGK